MPISDGEANRKYKRSLGGMPESTKRGFVGQPPSFESERCGGTIG